MITPYITVSMTTRARRDSVAAAMAYRSGIPLRDSPTSEVHDWSRSTPIADAIESVETPPDPQNDRT